MDAQALRAAEQAARLARIRAKIREGVWALREGSALPAHWDDLERGALAEGGAPEAGETGGVTAGLAVG